MLLVLSGSVLPASAQSDPYESFTQRTPSYQSFDAIKRDIAVLLQQNRALEEQYSEVEAKSRSTKEAYSQKKGEVDRLRRETGIVLRKSKNNVYEIESTLGDIESIKSAILIKKSRIAHLQGQIIMAEDKQVLWELQLQDLKNQQMQAEINSKKSKLSVEDKINADKLEIARLQKEINTLNQNLKALSTEHKSFQSLTQSAADSYKKIERSNDALKKQISILERERDLLYREIDNLEERQKIMNYSQSDVNYHKDYSKELGEEVSVLEEKYRNINATLQNKLNRAQHYKELSQEFIEASKANQLLRQQLNELQ